VHNSFLFMATSSRMTAPPSPICQALEQTFPAVREEAASTCKELPKDAAANPFGALTAKGTYRKRKVYQTFNLDEFLPTVFTRCLSFSWS